MTDSIGAHVYAFTDCIDAETGKVRDLLVGHALDNIQQVGNQPGSRGNSLPPAGVLFYNIRL